MHSFIIHPIFSDVKRVLSTEIKINKIALVLFLLIQYNNM